MHYKRLMALFLLVIVFFITHVPKLGSDEINPDAINWHQRAEQYIDAIKSRDFVRTYQHYHPGVTLMFLTGVPVELLKRYSGETIYSRITYEAFHFVAKYALNLTLLVLIVLLIFSLTRLIGFVKAYAVGVFLILEPFFLGNSRMLHMDALVSVFLANALVVFFLGLKTKSLLKVFLGSLLLGFSFWTKNVAVLAVVYSAVFTVFLFVFRKLDLKFTLVSLLFIVLGFFISGYSILPALWVNPSRVFTKIYGGSTAVVDRGHEEKFFGKIVMDPGPLYYPLVLVFKMSPFLFIGFVSSLVYLIFLLISEKKFIGSNHLLIYYILGFAFMYFGALEFAEKKIDRYLLPLFPLFFITVSYSMLTFFERKKFIRGGVFFMGLYVLLSTIDIFSYFPYLFVYNSPLVGGPRNAERVVGQKSFGIGVFEVRDFIMDNYGTVRVGFVDRKPISAIYPNSLVYDVRAYGPGKYDILVLDSDEAMPKKAEGKFVYDKSIRIAGLNFWNFYVKPPTK